MTTDFWCPSDQPRLKLKPPAVSSSKLGQMSAAHGLLAMSFRQRAVVSGAIWLPTSRCMACPTSCMVWPPTKRAPKKIIAVNRWLLLEQIILPFRPLPFAKHFQEKRRPEGHSLVAGLALAGRTCSSWLLSFLRGIWKQVQLSALAAQVPSLWASTQALCVCGQACQ